MKKRILIAEDNDIEGLILERTLKNKGYEVVRASDGLSALELIERSPQEGAIDLLITDLMMPGLSGIELLWHAKEKNLLPPAIVLTANASDEASIKSLEVGALDHVTKPINLPLILAKIQVILGKAA
jgi:DNA-binding response OmpR family regulator